LELGRGDYAARPVTMDKPPTKMAKIKLGMTLFLRCVGAIIFLYGLMGYACNTIAIMTLNKNDASLAYVNGQFIGSAIYSIFGVLLILLARPLVILLSRGLNENDF
jgi:hypothetical protein